APVEGLDRGGDQTVEIAASEPDPHVTDVDAETDAALEAARAAHAAATASMAVRTAARASPIRAGCPPPPWARSSLPPPRPPMASAPVRSREPAPRPCSRAARLAATTRAARSPS